MSPEGQLFGSKLGLGLWGTLDKEDYVHLVGMVIHYNWIWRVRRVAALKGDLWKKVDYNFEAQWELIDHKVSEQSQFLLDFHFKSITYAWVFERFKALIFNGS